MSDETEQTGAMPAGVSPGSRRVSCLKGDPGGRLFAEMSARNEVPTILLDGVEQSRCVTADEAQGFIIRMVQKPGGGIAVDRATGEILHEAVLGRVEIVVRRRT